MRLRPFETQTPRLRLAGLKHCGRGDSAQVVIAVHGWLDNAASFVPLAYELSSDYDFHAVELPGHGWSEHRPASTTYHLLENILDVLAFAEVVSPDRPVSLVGHSLGGIVCALLAAAAPERVSQLVLLDSLGPLTDSLTNVLPQLRKAIRKASLFRASKMTNYTSLERMVEVRTNGVGKVSMEAARLLVERGAVKVGDGYQWRSDPRLMAPSLLRFSEEQVEAIFEGIECPVCLICGEQGYFADYNRLQKRLGYIHSLTKHHVSGGHHFHMDGDVAGCAALITAFWEENHER